MVSFPQFVRQQRKELPIVATEATCQGRIFVVTGANTGLGFECAQHLVRFTAEKVILACRSIARGEAAKTRIEQTTGRSGGVEVWQVDMASYGSIQAFVKRLETLDRIDAVIENASVAMLEHQEAEGLESSLTINVVGTFLLAVLVLPLLHRSAKRHGTEPHLSIVGSEVAFGMKGELEKMRGDVIDGLSEKAKTSMANRYQVTKLLQCYCMRELARTQAESGSRVIINIVNPDLCKTELSRNAGTLLNLVFSVVKFFLARTAEMGSRTLLHGVFAGPESHGKYLSACEIQQDVPPDWVTDSAGQAMQARVWQSVSGTIDVIKPGCLKECTTGSRL